MLGLRCGRCGCGVGFIGRRQTRGGFPGREARGAADRAGQADREKRRADRAQRVARSPREDVGPVRASAIMRVTNATLWAGRGD